MTKSSASPSFECGRHGWKPQASKLGSYSPQRAGRESLVQRWLPRRRTHLLVPLAL